MHKEVFIGGFSIKSCFSSCLGPLKLIILIFSLIHKLPLLLKLHAVEDYLTIFHFFGGVKS